MNASVPSRESEIGREIATRMWPHHAERCSEHDWTVIEDAAKKKEPLDKRIIQPVGEAKDEILFSLMILYWTLKLVQLAIEISKEVSDLHGKEKAEAILKAVLDRMDSNTPESVSKRINEIIGSLN